jgi:hypothetical protein
MLNEEAFKKWAILNCDMKGISLNLYWGLGSKYLFFLFNFDVVARNVLQYDAWNIVDALASWCFDFNPYARSRAHYPL